MTLDIRGSLKNTKLSANRYVVFEELFSNAIDAFLIRQHEDSSVKNLIVNFVVNFWKADLLGHNLSLSIQCTDNGCGLADEQLKAFLTKDTSYKDDLEINGIGQCKGAGRIQYFHHFSDIDIVSGFVRDGVIYVREMHHHNSKASLEIESFSEQANKLAEIGTAITLSGIKPATQDKIFIESNLLELFSAKNLKNQILVSFLQRFIGLKKQLGEFIISFKTIFDNTEQVERLKPSDLPKVSGTRAVNVFERDPASGDRLSTYQALKLSHYKLSETAYQLPRNAIALCAKSSPVKDITSRYLRSKAMEANPIDGFHHIVLIEGDVLDSGVNEQRDGFDRIPEEIKYGDFFGSDKISFQTIYEAIDDVVTDFVAPPDWTKDSVVKGMKERFGVSETMLVETDTRVRYGDTSHTVVERVLKKYQEKIIDETSAIFELKEEIKNADPNSEEFRDKVNKFSWRYASSLQDMDKANLSQLVVRRAAIVEVLALAHERKLRIQSADDSKRKEDEKLIHNIFFPMRKDSTQTKDHDIWLLNEEYSYYDYIASDTPLSKLKWDGGGKLFEANVDAELATLLKKNSDENAGKRPDIAIFSKEGSAIIVEFKSLDVPMDDHVGDLMEYAQLLSAKSGGKLKKFYGYLIGNTLNPNRLRGYTRFPTGRGYFGTEPIVEHTSGQRLGELYSEILFYEDVVDRANKRLGVYRDKLGIKFS